MFIEFNEQQAKLVRNAQLEFANAQQRYGLVLAGVLAAEGVDGETKILAVRDDGLLVDDGVSESGGTGAALSDPVDESASDERRG